MNIKKNFLSVVVLFWNDSEKTIKCLDSLFKQKKIKFTIILVDNNSDEEYTKAIFNWLKKKKIKLFKIKKYQKIKNISSKTKLIYIKNKINYGCGLGHNVGYQLSIDNNFKYISRIDNDMILPSNLLYQLSARLEKNKNFIAISPKVMFSDNRNLIWFRGAKIGNNLKLQKQCSDFIPGEKDSNKIRGLVLTDAVVGCASIMRGANLKKSGFSDPDFFYGEEDIELSYRLKNTKGKLGVDLDSKIYHSVSHTVGKNWAKNIYYNYKYRLLLIKKIGSMSDKIIGYSVFFIKLILYLFLSPNKKYSSKLMPIFLAGVHYLKNQYGDYDRKNYKKIDYFFSKYDKKTTFFKILKNIYENKSI